MTEHGKMGGVKRGDNSMLCKVNWSAECLLTNYFNEVVSRNCYNILCYQFVVLFFLFPLRNKRNVRKKSRYEISPWTVASKFSVLNKPL